MPHFVSLDGDARRQRRLEHRLGLAADLHGNPVSLDLYQRGPDRFCTTTSVDSPSRGGSTLSHAVSEQLELEARDRAFLQQLKPCISKDNARMLERIFLEDLSLEEIGILEERSRAAISQRLLRLCRKYPDLAARWRRHKGQPEHAAVLPDDKERFTL